MFSEYDSRPRNMQAFNLNIEVPDYIISIKIRKLPSKGRFDIFTKR